MLQPDTAVIVDTETTDLGGVVIEIACIDAYDGRVLLDTLVNPNSKIAQRAAARLGQAHPASSSPFNVAKNDSARALSQH